MSNAEEYIGCFALSVLAWRVVCTAQENKMKDEDRTVTQGCWTIA